MQEALDPFASASEVHWPVCGAKTTTITAIWRMANWIEREEKWLTTRFLLFRLAEY
jgi:hypothetical protein